MDPGAFCSGWQDVAESIGLAGVPLHSLGHTHASQLIDAGVDVMTISKRLGHASPAITLKIYAHLFRKDEGRLRRSTRHWRVRVKPDMCRVRGGSRVAVSAFVLSPPRLSD